MILDEVNRNAFKSLTIKIISIITRYNTVIRKSIVCDQDTKVVGLLGMSTRARRIMSMGLSPPMLIRTELHWQSRRSSSVQISRCIVFETTMMPNGTV